MSRLILHADVGREEGWGHFRELLSVATILRARGIESTFAVPTSAKQARQELKKERYAALPADRYRQWAPGCCVVSDLIRYPADYVRFIRKEAVGWAIITEHEYEELASINFNICREPEFMPLHGQYRDCPPKKINDDLKKIFVCFGGADPKNTTGLVLEFLRQGFERAQLPRDVSLTVLLGPLFEHASAVKAMIKTYPVPMKVSGPVGPKIVARMALESDLTLTTGGGTMYEFCALGVPSIIIPILDKMDANARVVEKRLAVVRTPRVDRLSAEELIGTIKPFWSAKRRKVISRRSQKAIDGRGAERIADKLLKAWRLK